MIIIGIIITFGLSLLNSYLGAIDEKEWIQAGSIFLTAIRDHNWAGTYVGAIGGHPGVTVLWVSAIVQGLNQNPISMNLYAAHRIVFSAINLLLLGFSLFILKNRLKPLILFFCFLYWLTSPFLLLNLEAVWTDQLLAWISFLAIVVWTNSPVSERNWLLTGALTGLALLTKVSGIFLLPVFLITGLSFYRSRQQLLLALGTVLITAAIVFFAVYPAMWVKPLSTPFNRFNNSSRVEFRPNLSTETIMYYPQKTITTDPIIFAGIVLLAYSFFKRKPEVFSISGGIYLLFIFLASLFLKDFGNGPQAFFRWSGRYLSVAVPFFTIALFSRIPNPKITAFIFLVLTAWKTVFLFAS